MSATNVPPQGDGAAPGNLPVDFMQFLPPDLMAQLQGGTGEQFDPEGIDPEAIGGFFDPGYFGTETVPQMQFQVPQGVDDTITRPFYKDGDEWRTIQGLPPEELRSLQDRMQFIGILDDMDRGDPTLQKTMNAQRDLLTIANRQGRSWREALAGIETSVKNGAMKPFGQEQDSPQVPAFEKVPDYATISQRVKRTFRDQLGRDPTQAEMQIFSNQMMADYRVSAEQDFRRRADTRDLPDDVGAAHVPTQQEVDPVARFNEAFEQRMGGQIETLEKQANTRQGAAAAQQAVTATDRLTGGR